MSLYDRTDLPIKGVFCAALTPLTTTLEPDLGRLGEHCRQLLAAGCDGIALLGTTGEASSFSSEERMRILEGAVRAGVSPTQLLPGVGVPAFTETIQLARHALSLGVETVVVLPPYYYKGVTDQGLLDFYTLFIERVANPKLRIVLYHIPQVTQVPLSLPLIKELRRRFGETVVGVKDSGGDLQHMQMLVRELPGLAVFAGADPLFGPLLDSGGAGCITATSNLIAADLAFIARSERDAPHVAETEATIAAVRNAFLGPQQIALLKAVLAKLSGHASWSAVRPPFTRVSPSEAAAVVSTLNVPEIPAVAGTLSARALLAIKP